MGEDRKKKEETKRRELVEDIRKLITPDDQETPKRELNIENGKILFFEGKGFVSKGIGLVTRGKRTHVALLTSKGKILESWQGKGVRERDLLTDWSGVHAFDFVNPVSIVHWDRVVERMRSQIGCGYDYMGILRFLTRKQKVELDDKWFCSEFLYWAWMEEGIPLLADFVQPSLVHPELASYSPIIHEVPLFKEDI